MPQKQKPLCIDLDGTLIRTDVLQESLLEFIKLYPWKVFHILFWILKGRAYLKKKVAEKIILDPALLPYNEKFLKFLKQQKNRDLYLVTAADKKVALPIAKHLKIFKGVLASDGKTNLRSHAKAKALVQKFGERKFTYAGNSRHDLAVWEKSYEAIAVTTPASVLAKLKRFRIHTSIFNEGLNPLGGLLKSLRLYQWVKNLLVFLPFLASHQFGDLSLLLKSSLAFVCFSLAASSIYIVNDLFDLASDRLHATKKQRPFASGAVPIPLGGYASVSLMIASLLLSLLWLPALTKVLLAYIVLTTLYSLRLKAMIGMDVVTLALLYTLRIIGGYEVTGLSYSNWLLSFSLFTFLSLAFLKRLIEIKRGTSKDNTLKGRGYTQEDRTPIIVFGATSGFLAILILVLYIESAPVMGLYPHKFFLWGLCPLFVYKLIKLWLQANRGGMEDDPVLVFFKSKDTYFIAFLSLVLILLASF
jgi:4-hydroxybenzoate polyprenyltransferase